MKTFVFYILIENWKVKKVIPRKTTFKNNAQACCKKDWWNPRIMSYTDKLKPEKASHLECFQSWCLRGKLKIKSEQDLGLSTGSIFSSQLKSYHSVPLILLKFSCRIPTFITFMNNCCGLQGFLAVLFTSEQMNFKCFIKKSPFAQGLIAVNPLPYIAGHIVTGSLSTDTEFDGTIGWFEEATAGFESSISHAKGKEHVLGPHQLLILSVTYKAKGQTRDDISPACKFFEKERRKPNTIDKVIEEGKESNRTRGENKHVEG